MSELMTVRDQRATMRKQLLATASALALIAYVTSTNVVKADDADRPTVWVELGGQMEMMQGASSSFTAPFMTALTPTPGAYRGGIFDQKRSGPAFGLEGKVTFEPQDSNWVFSAGIRYGRSHSNRHIHNQTVIPGTYTFGGVTYTGYYVYGSPFADSRTPYKESHTILDFQAGKDFGIGALGSEATSTLSVGVRYAQFSFDSSLHISARPSVHYTIHFGPFIQFNQYMLSGAASRNFHGIGPSLSWTGSAPLLGDKDRVELALDWGINAALLFGRQKAKTHHETAAYYENGKYLRGRGFEPLYTHGPYHSTRSHSVTVPNVGGFAGVSVNYTNARISFGYRADFFFGAVDAGIDARQTKDLVFHGPFAAISIGLGG